MVRTKKCNKGKINTKRRMKQVTKVLENGEHRKKKKKTMKQVTEGLGKRL
jgi:hypothetical protein